MEGSSADAVLGALGDPTRRHLLQALADAGPATATELAHGLPVTRQAVTKHLSALEAAGLAQRERAGREVRYRLEPAPLSEAAGWMTGVGAQWDARLAALERHLARPRRG